MNIVLSKKATWLTCLQLLFSLSILAQLTANFTPSTISGCSPLTVNFKNATTGGTSPYTWLWRLDNGNISTLTDAAAIYTVPRTYNITLIATDKNGKVDSITKSVIIYGAPSADLKADVVIGCPPFTVNFTDLSKAGSGGISTWLWDFGDGVTSAIQNPSHTYNTTGKFIVSLLVVDKFGCQNFIKKTNLIVSNSPPTIDFTASPPGGCSAPVSIKFSPNINPSGIYTYSWDFGDGGSSTASNPSYTYNSPGTYTVNLKVSDNAGCTAQKIKNGFIFIGKPKADFSFSPANGCSPIGVNFSDNSSGGSKYYWDFGDGKTSTDANPFHTFNVGTYTVKFVVTSASGCSDSVIKKNVISVTPGFKASFTSDSVLCSRPFTSTFKNTSGANTTVVTWDFGDNKTSSASNPTHIYPDTGGYYTVTLTVTDGNGCYESVKKSNTINAQATSASISYGSYEGCAPFIFNFTNNSFSIDPIASYFWDFGDGKTSTAANPASHTYADTGTFKVVLNIVTQKGCKSSTGLTVNAGTRPHADFTAQPVSGCLNNLRHVHFTNLTNTSGKIKADRYSWEFGDGEFSYDISPTHRYYKRPGDYTVKLIAYNKGCADTMTAKKLIHITGPWAQYVVTRKGCTQNVVSFFDSSINSNHVKYVFGDGTTDTTRNPVHTYAAGVYKPYQIVYNDTSGCTDTFSLYFVNPLVIDAPWTVTITTGSLTKGCAPLTVDFNLNDNDSADNVIYFGDGDSVTVSSIHVPSQVVSHTYIKKGTYNVSVKGTNPHGCQVNALFKQTIIVSGAFAKFSVDKQGGCVPLKILLTDSSTKDNTITKKIYTMGNGDIINVSRDTISYIYTKPPPNQYGGYTIIEEVSDNTGCTNTFANTVYPSFPIADFNLDSNITCKQVIYSMVPTDIGLGPFKYAWDLGNGTKSVLRAPVLTYKNGTYNVTLAMTDANGCTAQVSHAFTVHKTNSKADFGADTTYSQCPPFHAYFTDKSKFAFGGYRGYEWNFGDGSPHSYVRDPQKVYYDAGSFTVTLKITDSLGCTDSITKTNLIKVNGAIGTYSFSPKRGCTPLTVRFVAISKNATKFLWDMGDGSLKGGDTINYTYTATRTYIPLLILSDSSGCTYTLPAKDTIHVDALPVPDFIYDSICSGSPTYFFDASSASAGQLTQWQWDFGDGQKGNGPDPSHIYAKNGYYIVSLNVANSQGCSKTRLKKIRIGGIVADFSSGKTGCVASPVQFKDKSISDTMIKSWRWSFGDGTTSTLQNPTHTYYQKGQYRVSLYADNYKGCYDSISRAGYQIIGDTVPPPPPMLYRVSVVGDSAVEVVFSKYKDVDFNHYRIYMKDIAGNFSEVDRTYNIDDTAHIVRNLSTLHNVYCFKVQAVNACGKLSALSPYHCTIDITAMPGNDQALLSWTPYIGWQNILQYNIDRMSYYNAPAFVHIGTVSGNTLNFTDTAVICYRPVTYRIKAIEDRGYYQISLSDTGTTLPRHINRVPAAEMVRVTVPDNKYNMIEWKDTSGIKVKKWLLEKSTDGINYTPIDTPFYRNVNSVLDPRVDVQNHNYYYRLRILDSCGDLGQYSEYGRNMVLRTDTTADVKPYLHWTPYKNWPEGVDYYDIEIKDANGNYHFLAKTQNINDTFFTDNITDRNSLPQYCYRIVAHRGKGLSNITSMSNEACLKVKSRVFIPNAFTPYNYDYLNDKFVIQGLYIRDFHIKIFDRWGTKVFESSSLNDSWDGRFKTRRPLIDAYRYEVYVRGVDNQVYFINGWVTIVM